MEFSKPKVVIIGAGRLGLMGIRYLKDKTNVTAFDCQDQLGGMWVYTEDNEINSPTKDDIFYEHYGCLRSSMYRDLVVNIPYHITGMKNFPINNPSSDFPTREEYLQYLISYATYFDLHNNIQLNTFVQSVRLVSGLTAAEKEEWKITEGRKFAVKCCNSLNKHEVSYHEADYVIVANGHNSVPRIPKIDGDDEYEGEIYHFHNFRHFDALDFKHKSILIIGFGTSSLDFIVHLMFNPHLPREYFGTIYFAGEVESIQDSKDFKVLYETGKLILKNGYVHKLGKNKQVTFADGSTATVDMIWYTTGYQYKFPFLENSPDKLIDLPSSEHDGNFWGPLYQLMFSINEPNLIFIGTISAGPVLPYLEEIQAILVTKYIKGDLNLPNKQQMLESWKDDVAEVVKKRPLRKFYCLIPGVNDRPRINQYRELANSKEGNEDFDKALDEFVSFGVECLKSGNWVTYRSTDMRQFFPEDFHNSSSFL